jgi:hypothetical protein
MDLIKTPFGFSDTAAEVAAFTASWDGPLHVLVNNAGVMASPEQGAATSVLLAKGVA